MIECENLTYKYPENDKNALTGINLKIRRGEFVAILGHNGSGKSTLAKHFNALLLPTEGKCIVNDMDTSDESLLFKVRSSCGMVFQNPDNQIVSSIVEEDVAFAVENLGLPSEEIRRRVDWALDTVGMGEYARHAPHLLSGGQKQRIAIAGVIAMRPACIVLDEPTAMLDPKGRKGVIETIRELHKSGTTIVLITHNMNEACLAGRVVVLNEGVIVADGKPRKVYEQGKVLAEAGLELPQIAQLMRALDKPIAFDVEGAISCLS